MVPTTFSFYAWSFDGEYRVTLEKEDLVLRYPIPHTGLHPWEYDRAAFLYWQLFRKRGHRWIRYSVREEHWRQYFEALDRLGVWAWAEDYQRGTVLDGLAWSIEVVASGRTLRSKGNWLSPPDDVPNFRPAFEAFVAATRWLVGGHPLLPWDEESRLNPRSPRG